MVATLSSAAVCEVTVSQNVLEEDFLLAIVLKLSSSYQVGVDIELKKKDVLCLRLGNPCSVTLTQRNAVLRALAGPALHGALDKLPYYLLGGLFDVCSSIHGSNDAAAFSFSRLTSWMSIAAEIRQSEVVTTDLLTELNEHLNRSSFLVTWASCTLADLDLALTWMELTKRKTVELDATRYPAFDRWLRHTQNVISDLASRAGVILPEHFKPPAVTPKMISFFQGTEDVDAILSLLYKNSNNNNNNTAEPNTLDRKEKELDEPKESQTKNKSSTAPAKAQPVQPKAKNTNDISNAQNNSNNNNNSVEFTISALDIRVGKIIKVWEHPEAEKLFCEQIDLGNGEIRSIASGLRPFYKAEDLLHRHVLVLCNLKSRSLVGFQSHGMVLCASNDDHTCVEFVVPPDNAELGERVMFEGCEMGPPEPENKVAKKKIFEKIAPDLKTNELGQVVWNQKIATTKHGIVKALNGMPNAKVS